MTGAVTTKRKLPARFVGSFYYEKIDNAYGGLYTNSISLEGITNDKRGNLSVPSEY